MTPIVMRVTVFVWLVYCLTNSCLAVKLVHHAPAWLVYVALMMNAASTVNVAVADFFRRGIAHFADVDVEGQGFASERMIGVDGDGVVVDFGDGNQHGLLA